MSRAARFLLRHAGKLFGALVIVWLLSIGLAIGAPRGPRAVWMSMLVLLIVAMFVLTIWARWQRERAVRESALPQFLKRKLRERHPQLDGRSSDLVERGFRQFFLACVRSDKKFVAMPSRVVDAYWREFTQHARAYADWCELTLGRVLPHTPAVPPGADASDNDGLRRAWYWSCRDEAIDPRRPSRLPLLFALDKKLAIAGGIVYVADVLARSAAAAEQGAYSGTSFADGSLSGDEDGFGGVDTSDGGSSDGDGGGGGDGGD
jgi:hypothetical protein